MAQTAKKLKKGYGMPTDFPNLFEAAARNDVPAIKVALEHYDINDTDKFKMSALHHAAAYGAMEAIDYLIEQGIDGSIKDKFGRLASWVPLEVLGPELGAPIANKLGPICTDYSKHAMD
jgi:ankyrin repeat protein|tara:strand:- start:12 stop:368 length:357 start_codon:yes stop_codon:yes gene_type:complete